MFKQYKSPFHGRQFQKTDWLPFRGPKFRQIKKCSKIWDSGRKEVENSTWLHLPPSFASTAPEPHDFFPKETAKRRFKSSKVRSRMDFDLMPRIVPDTGLDTS